LVVSERHAKQVFYQIADGHMSDMLIAMADHISKDQYEKVTTPR